MNTEFEKSKHTYNIKIMSYIIFVGVCINIAYSLLPVFRFFAVLIQSYSGSLVNIVTFDSRNIIYVIVNLIILMVVAAAIVISIIFFVKSITKREIHTGFSFAANILFCIIGFLSYIICVIFTAKKLIPFEFAKFMVFGIVSFLPKTIICCSVSNIVVTALVKNEVPYITARL